VSPRPSDGLGAGRVRDARGFGAVARLPVDRERILRTLTFWLRPAFVLRVAGRFQRIAGFDRAIALASSALTALIPLLIFTSALLPRIGGEGAADDIIARYDLSGESAEAVKEVFSPSSDVSTSIGIVGALFVLLAVLSFTRTIQRLFEQTWELPPLSVRNSLNGVKWIGTLIVYSMVTGAIRRFFDRGALEIASAFVLVPLSCAFVIWTAYILSARRIPWRDLIAFGVVCSVLLAIYSVGASIYVPRLLDSYADRYGVIGVVFAMISALFASMLVIVGSAALGREVHDELGRIKRGERPSEDEVQEQWDEIITEARSRWATAREAIERRREAYRNRKAKRSGADGEELVEEVGQPPPEGADPAAPQAADDAADAAVADASRRPLSPS
jgi:membrane protein